MFNLIPISLLITAIGGIVYIISGHLSEFSEKNEENNEESGDVFRFNVRARFADWANQLPLGNVKIQSLSIAKKFLHRSRLVLLKTDNHLMKLLDKISQKDKEENEKNNGNGNTPDFWDDFAKERQQKQIILPPADFVTPKANFVQPKAESEVKIDLALKSATAKKFFDVKPVKKTLKTKKSLK